MKKTHLAIIPLFAVTLAFSFCTKSTYTAPVSIVGTWTVDSQLVKVIVNNQPVYQTYYNEAFDYYDFTVDSVSLRWNGTDYAPTHYTIVSKNGQKLVQYATSTDTILTLTAHSLILKSHLGSDSKIFFTRF